MTTIIDTSIPTSSTKVAASVQERFEPASGTCPAKTTIDTSKWTHKLHHGTDMHSNKVLLYMKMKGINFESHFVDRNDDKCVSEFKKISHGKTHPQLLMVSTHSEKGQEDIILSEANSIIMFLEHYYREKPLSSLDCPRALAAVLECLDEINELSFTLRHWKEYKLSTKGTEELEGASASEKLFLKALKNDILFILGLFEDRLKNSKGNGAFLVGDKATLVDVTLVPYLMWILRRNGKFDKSFPHIQTYINHAWKCDAVKEVFSEDYVKAQDNPDRWVMGFIN